MKRKQTLDNGEQIGEDKNDEQVLTSQSAVPRGSQYPINLPVFRNSIEVKRYDAGCWAVLGGGKKSQEEGKYGRMGEEQVWSWRGIVALHWQSQQFAISLVLSIGRFVRQPVPFDVDVDVDVPLSLLIQLMMGPALRCQYMIQVKRTNPERTLTIQRARKNGIGVIAEVRGER